MSSNQPLGRSCRARAWAGLRNFCSAHHGLGQEKVNFPMGSFSSAHSPTHPELWYLYQQLILFYTKFAWIAMGDEKLIIFLSKYFQYDSWRRRVSLFKQRIIPVEKEISFFRVRSSDSVTHAQITLGFFRALFL